MSRAVPFGSTAACKLGSEVHTENTPKVDINEEIRKGLIEHSRMVQEVFSLPIKEMGSDQESFTNKYNFEEACCPICMEPWSSQGDHQVSCLPCGHVYGFSCIIKWKRHCHGHSTQCPQCNSIFEPEDIRKLYTSPTITPDEYLIKKMRHLEAENECLKVERKKNEELLERAAHRSQLTEIMHKLNNERKASYNASTILQHQLKDLIAERDELSKKLSGMEMLVADLKYRLKMDDALSASVSQYTTNDTAKLQTEILERLRGNETQAHTAEDRVVQLESEIMEQRARIAAAGVRLLSSQSSNAGDTSGSKAQGLGDYISVHEVVQLLVNLSKGVATSLDSVNNGGENSPIIIDD